LKVKVLPTDLSEAAGINSLKGMWNSSKTFIISVPTNPVAPISAIFIQKLFYNVHPVIILAQSAQPNAYDKVLRNTPFFPKVLPKKAAGNHQFACQIPES